MRQAFIDALDGLYDSMGEPARHLNRDGEYRDCRVIWSADLEQWGETAEVQSITAMLKVRRADLKESPRRGEWFILADGTEFKVASVRQADELEFSIAVG